LLRGSEGYLRRKKSLRGGGGRIGKKEGKIARRAGRRVVRDVRSTEGADHRMEKARVPVEGALKGRRDKKGERKGEYAQLPTTLTHAPTPYSIHPSLPDVVRGDSRRVVFFADEEKAALEVKKRAVDREYAHSTRICTFTVSFTAQKSSSTLLRSSGEWNTGEIVEKEENTLLHAVQVDARRPQRGESRSSGCSETVDCRCELKWWS
jgi:hypothetical protein